MGANENMREKVFIFLENCLVCRHMLKLSFSLQNIFINIVKFDISTKNSQILCVIFVNLYKMLQMKQSWNVTQTIFCKRSKDSILFRVYVLDNSKISLNDFIQYLQHSCPTSLLNNPNQLVTNETAFSQLVSISEFRFLFWSPFVNPTVGPFCK